MKFLHAILVMALSALLMTVIAGIATANVPGAAINAPPLPPVPNVPVQGGQGAIKLVVTHKDTSNPYMHYADLLYLSDDSKLRKEWKYTDKAANPNELFIESLTVPLASDVKPSPAASAKPTATPTVRASPPARYAAVGSSPGDNALEIPRVSAVAVPTPLANVSPRVSPGTRRMLAVSIVPTIASPVLTRAPPATRVASPTARATASAKPGPSGSPTPSPAATVRASPTAPVRR